MPLGSSLSQTFASLPRPSYPLPSPPPPPRPVRVYASLTVVFSYQGPSHAFRRSQLSLLALRHRSPPSPLAFHVVDNPRGLSLSRPKPAHKQHNFTHVFSNPTPVSVFFYWPTLRTRLVFQRWAIIAIPAAPTRPKNISRPTYLNDYSTYNKIC